jgi:hypothetical protein
MQTSMETFNSAKVRQNDIHKVFRRAHNREVMAVGGTEVGKADSIEALGEACADYGFRLYVSRTVFMAINIRMIDGQSWEQGFIKSVDSSEGDGQHSDRGLLWVSFDSVFDIGRLSFGETHFLKHGRQKKDPNWRLNNRICDDIAAWGRERGAGPDKAFVFGDVNDIDNKHDVFRGGPFTTFGDALEKHPNTGHGPIDVMAKYDRDGKVVPAYWRAQDDSEFPLGTDHYLTEGAVDVES